jgi:hypothetical protein
MRSYCRPLLFSAFLCGTLVAAGCRKPAESSVEIPAKERESTEVSAEHSAAASGRPAAAWQHVVDQLVRGETSTIEDVLPEQYRADLDRMLQSRLEPVASDVRRDACDALAAFAQTLANKEEFVLGSARFNFGGPAAPFVRHHFEPLCRVLAAVANWPGWSAEKAPTIGAVIQEIVRAGDREASLKDALKSIRFENAAKPEQGSETQVFIHTADAKEPRTISVVRVEDRWLPQALVQRWPELFGGERADEVASASTQRENRLREFTSRLREITASLDGVKTQAEFDALAERAATLLLASAAEAHATPRRVESDEFVTVVVKGDLSDGQKDQLVWDLASMSDEPASGLADALEQSDGTYVIQVGPVRDVASFAKRLEGLVVENVDAGGKKITARVAAP